MINIYVFDVADTDTLKEQALEGARMGYTGKQVIHPIQVPIVQDAFSPSPKKVEWATELIKAFEEHQESGKASSCSACLTITSRSLYKKVCSEFVVVV